MIQAFEDQCSDEIGECIISLNNAFNLKWDRLFIFDSMLYPEEISEALGFDYSGDIVPEGKSLFIFVLNNTIIKEQKSRCSDIIFVNMKNDGVVKINSKEEFIIRRRKTNNKIQYLMYSQD